MRTASARLFWRPSSPLAEKKQSPRAKDHPQLISRRPCDVPFFLAPRIHRFHRIAEPDSNCSSSLYTDPGRRTFPQNSKLMRPPAPLVGGPEGVIKKGTPVMIHDHPGLPQIAREFKRGRSEPRAFQVAANPSFFPTSIILQFQTH